jgi:hypothetical protein
MPAKWITPVARITGACLNTLSDLFLHPKFTSAAKELSFAMHWIGSGLASFASALRPKLHVSRECQRVRLVFP